MKQKIQIDALPCKSDSFKIWFWLMIVGELISFVIDLLSITVYDPHLLDYIISTVCGVPGLIFGYIFANSIKAVSKAIYNIIIAILILLILHSIFSLSDDISPDESLMAVSFYIFLAITILSLVIMIMMYRDYSGLLGDLGLYSLKTLGYSFLAIVLLILYIYRHSYSRSFKALDLKDLKIIIAGSICGGYIVYYIISKILKTLYLLLKNGYASNLFPQEMEAYIAQERYNIQNNYYPQAPDTGSIPLDKSVEVNSSEQSKETSIPEEQVKEEYESPDNSIHEVNDYQAQNQSLFNENVTPDEPQQVYVEFTENKGSKRKYWYIALGCVVALVAGVLIYIFSSEKSSSSNYEELFNKYYGESTPKPITNEGWWSVTGKFDGKNEETLTVFPLDSTLGQHGEYEVNSYSKMLICSKDGKAPDLIIDMEKAGPNIIGFGFGDIAGSSILLSSVPKSKGSPDRKDLLEVNIYPFESTISITYRYELIDGEWSLVSEVTVVDGPSPEESYSTLTKAVTDSPYQIIDGVKTHFFKGYFNNEGKRYPIMLAFAENDNSPGHISGAVYKNLSSGTVLDLDILFDKTIDLRGYDGNNFIDITLDSFENSILKGTASYGSLHTTVEIESTNDRFDLTKSILIDGRNSLPDWLPSSVLSTFGRTDLSMKSEDWLRENMKPIENVTLNGKFDTYPIVTEINVGSDGSVSGRYAYKSTLEKYGDKSSSWFKLKGQVLFDSNDTPFIVMQSINPDSGDVYEYALVEYKHSSGSGKLFNKKYLDSESPKFHTLSFD